MAFDPNQPRDDHGRWTATGQGGEGHYDELTSTNLIQSDGAKPGTRTNAEIGKILNERGQKALEKLGISGGVIDKSTPEGDNIVSSAIASEISAELNRGGNTAEDWYTKSFDDAMKVASEAHPEIAKDPGARFAYTAALAVTSQGERVDNNAVLAEKVYSEFAKTGKFPTDVVSATAEQMNGNFKKLNALTDKLGPEGVRAFMSKEFTVRELEKHGYKISGALKDDKVYGSAILGSKIGQGFFQNLNGNYEPLTMDMWFMRGWGRLTGTLVGTVDVTPMEGRFAAALKDAGQKVPKDLKQAAYDAVRQHEKNYKENADKFKSGKIKKSEIALSAERLVEAYDGLKDMPSSGGDRNWMRDVFRQAQAKLADAGHRMSIADMQATWWYPEKKLYEKMGGRKSEGLNQNYASAIKKAISK